MRRAKVILFVISICLFIAPTASAAMVEREAALAELHELELIVYVGDSGSIGMSGPSFIEQAAHPSALFRLLDAKLKNDNGLIGSADAIYDQLDRLSLSIEGLVPADNDFELLQQESADATGFTFSERLVILEEKLQWMNAVLPASGVSNEARLQFVMDRTAAGIARINELIDTVASDGW